MQPETNARVGLRHRGATALFLSANALLFAVLARRAPEIKVDTASYLQHAITRTPGYPLFLDLMVWLGRGHGLKLAQLVQLALGFFAAGHLAGALRRRLRLGAIVGALIYGLLLVPQARLGQVICTESLSYSLLLLLLGQLVRSLFELRSRPVIAAAALLFLLLLVRPQFFFLVPPAVLYLGWLCVRRRCLFDNLACACALVLAVGGSLLAQAAYNYAYNGRFARIPFTGVQVLSVALYFAGPADVARVPDERGARYLGMLLELAEERGWQARYRHPRRSTTEHFESVYIDLCYHGVLPTYLPFAGVRELTSDDWVAMDGLTLRLGLRLLSLHRREFARLALKELQETAGYLPLLMLLMVAGGGLLYLRTADPAALLPLMAGVLGWCNYLLIVWLEPLGTRYVIYTENIQLPLLLAFCAYLAGPLRSVALGALPQGLQHHLQEPPLVHNEIA